MKLRVVACIVALTCGILAVLLAAEAQQATKVHRIGRLSDGPPLPEPDPILDAFRQRLHEIGYIEGQNLVIKTARAIGLTIPPSVLFQADEVLQ